MKIGIVILATNSYFVLGVRFIKRFMHFYQGKEEIKFFFFSDRDPKDYLPDNTNNVEYIFASNKSWVDGTNMKFSSILSLQDRDIDYIYYFDADTNVNQPFTEEWFIGDMVGGQHYGDQSWMKEKKGYDRNPKSKAYIPLDTPLPQMYYYGAFFGGRKERVIEFCNTLREWQKADKLWGYEPGVNDESYIQKYFHYNPPTAVLCKDFKFAISDKGGIGETRRMDLDVSSILEEMRRLRNDKINITGGKIYHEQD